MAAQCRRLMIKIVASCGIPSTVPESGMVRRCYIFVSLSTSQVSVQYSEVESEIWGKCENSTSGTI